MSVFTHVPEFNILYVGARRDCLGSRKRARILNIFKAAADKEEAARFGRGGFRFSIF